MGRSCRFLPERLRGLLKTQLPSSLTMVPVAFHHAAWECDTTISPAEAVSSSLPITRKLPSLSTEMLSLWLKLLWVVNSWSLRRLGLEVNRLNELLFVFLQHVIPNMSADLVRFTRKYDSRNLHVPIQTIQSSQTAGMDFLFRYAIRALAKVSSISMLDECFANWRLDKVSPQIDFCVFTECVYPACSRWVPEICSRAEVSSIPTLSYVQKGRKSSSILSVSF